LIASQSPDCLLFSSDIVNPLNILRAPGKSRFFQNPQGATKYISSVTEVFTTLDNILNLLRNLSSTTGVAIKASPSLAALLLASCHNKSIRYLDIIFVTPNLVSKVSSYQPFFEVIHTLLVATGL
jgi:hypothetical protein